MTEDNVCQGACQLSKQIEQAEQEADKIPQSAKEKAEVLFCQTIQPLEVMPEAKKQLTSTPEAFYLESTSLAFVGDIFHPPIA